VLVWRAWVYALSIHSEGLQVRARGAPMPPREWMGGLGIGARQANLPKERAIAVNELELRI
jgi:hypothetical protein